MIGASAAVVCLGGLLAACGSGGPGGGYTAVGPAGGSGGSGRPAGPTGGVTLVPLDGDGESGGGDTAGNRGGHRGDSNSPRPSGASVPAPTSPPGATTSASPSADGADSGRTTTKSPSPTATPSPAPPPGPAALTWSDPRWKATDRRWCDDVTVDFRNSGGTAVRSGTVTFGTHIIGLLGIDWATVRSTEELPAPIEAHSSRQKTWTVCVDEWRVPLGMHVETRDVSVQWK